VLKTAMAQLGHQIAGIMDKNARKQESEPAPAYASAGPASSGQRPVPPRK